MVATVMNRILLVLGYGGVFVSGVLSLAELVGKEVPCGMDSGCGIVARHPTSHLLGVPNAYLGFIAYVALALFATYREVVGVTGPKPRLTMYVGYAIAALGTMASIILTFISITQIHATCKWCLASSAIMTLTLVAYMVLTIKADQAPTTASRSPFGMLLIAVLVVGCLGGISVAAKNFRDFGSTVKTLDPSVISDLIGKDAHIQNPNGVVTIIEFGDLDCPNCKHVYPQMEQMVQNSGGRLRYIFHHFPLYKNPEHPGALVGAVVAEMAAEKGKFWQFLDTVYGNGDADPAAPPPQNDDMFNFGKRVGLDDATMRKRVVNLDDPAFVIVHHDLDMAAKYGIGHTPEFIIFTGNENYTQVSGNGVFTVLDDPKFKKLIKGP